MMNVMILKNVPTKYYIVRMCFDAVILLLLRNRVLTAVHSVLEFSRIYSFGGESVLVFFLRDFGHELLLWDGLG